MTEAMEQRARRASERAAVRAWEYRQRHRSKGVWFRLRRVLADAERAYSVSDEDAAALVAEGFAPHPVGDELEPSKRIVFVPSPRAARIASRKEIPVSLGPELLEQRCIVLVRFSGTDGER